MWVCLFDDDGNETRHQLTEQTLGIWHGALPGVDARHALRLPGRRALGARRGLRFNPRKLLLDPYARAVSGRVTA